VELGKPLAIGRTAEVYDWGEGRVLKLIRPEMPASLGETEARAVRAAMAAGLATPGLLETIALEGRYGLVYERVDGPSMLEALSAQPWSIGKLAGQMAGLQASMHDARAQQLPDLKAHLGRMIKAASKTLTPDLTTAALGRLRDLPDGTAILHGDLHPGNIVMTERGPVVIDWLTVTQGDPAADVARTLLLLRGGALPGGAPRLQRAVTGLGRSAFTRSYLRAYRGLRQVDIDAVRAWSPVVMAARLAEGIEAEEEALLEQVRRELA